LAKLWLDGDGLSNYDSLTPYDRTRFSFIQGEFLSLLMARRNAVKHNFIEPEDYEYWACGLGLYTRLPGAGSNG
jgi:hypothetical protein